MPNASRMTTAAATARPLMATGASWMEVLMGVLEPEPGFAVSDKVRGIGLVPPREGRLDNRTCRDVCQAESLTPNVDILPVRPNLCEPELAEAVTGSLAPVHDPYLHAGGCGDVRGTRHLALHDHLERRPWREESLSRLAASRDDPAGCH